MIKLLIKILILSLPFALIAPTVVIVDPYNYFPNISPVSFKIKEKLLVDSHRNEAIFYGIWKTIEFKRNPVDCIILGDSRPFQIDTKQVYTLTGDKYFNFAIPASNLDTACAMFWSATKQIKLRKVYLGVGFQNYNGCEANQMYKEIERCTSNVYLYPFESRAMSSTVKIIIKMLKKQDAVSREDKVTSINNSRWNEIIYLLNNTYSNYTYPTTYYNMLSQISSYCKLNNIELHIIIYPQHQDIRDIVTKYNLSNSYNKFLIDMNTIGIVHNQDSNPLTYQNKSLFTDPIHPNNEYNKAIINEVWKLF
jgi:hypothetical protein